MTNKLFYITLLTVLGFNTEAHCQVAPNVPKLVVSIVIDQLRSDYLEAFAPLYSTDGFKKLMEEGLVYQSASYPFTPVDRASAIAALASGVTPYYNNIIGERWLSRETLRPIFCVDDDKYTGLITNETASPTQLCTSTVGDELKVATSGKAVVYAIAPTRDAAVLSGGHAADGALWLDDISGNWCSSKYYFKELPKWLKSYNEKHAPHRKMQEVTWEPINTLVGNFNYFMHTGIQKPFSHTFKGARCYSELKASALINEEVTNLAEQCIASNEMGSDRITDLLCLTYYAGNYNHYTLTECHMELLDTYVRLDREISHLIRQLERQIGKENVLFVVTSTGYSDEEASDYSKYHIPSGTFYMSRTSNLLNVYFGALWGTGKYVDTHFRNQIFLDRNQLESKRISIAEATSRAQEFLAMLSGVSNVYTSLQLMTSNNEHLWKIRNGFNAERCGDIIIETAPGWTLLDEDTQETEVMRASYVPFPVMFYGTGVGTEKILTPVTTDRVAPTITRAIRIRAPNACASEPLF